MTQVAQRNNHVLQMLKRLRETLDNDKKKYADKVNVLVMTWERIAASAKEQRPLAAICIVEKMYKDTLSIMLQGEWPKMSPVSKTHLMQMLNRCRTDLCKEMPWLNSKFRKLLELVNDPWTLPSLERILHKDPSPATPEQIVEFCESERGLLIVTRLNMLCSSRCEKVAIKLAEACFGALNGGNTKLLSFFTPSEYNFIFDIYLCLLYKYRKLEFIINALKTVSVRDGYYLVLRLRKRSGLHEQKIWKFSHQVAAVASRYFVTVSMLSRTIPDPSLLQNLIRDWLSICNSDENSMENEIRKVMQPAETSEHIYIMAEVLTVISQKLGNQMYSSLIMELYIRALTADINYLERVKLQNDKEQMTAYEKHLASKFLALADLVKDHSGVRREFVLTAFSIHPSAEIYRRVEEEAVASGKASPHSVSQESVEVGILSEGLSVSSVETDGKETTTDYCVNNDSQDSGAYVEISNRCPLHLPYDGNGPEGELCFQCGDFTGKQTSQIPSNCLQGKKERSLDALILIKGNTVTESLNYDVLSAPSQVLEAEKLGLTSQVCADLVTLLGSNRYHLLTWVLEWGELSSRCLRYMDEAETIKSGKKELKFLEIDYNQYKDWPENEDDEADCIEKGYEQWLEDDYTETDFDTDSKRSNTDDSEELMIKTAIRRSQKQTGRYAESSSDSEDSRSRPRNRKCGRPRKRLKSFSDSGSVSDSLGSDGQKQKLSSKKSRTKAKDLRKTLGRIKVLEMANDISHFSSSGTNLSSDVISTKMYGLPSSGGVRSDPTVLKSLRAFRPNAHKTKTEDFIKSASENCYNFKMADGKPTSNKKTTSVFDCNDNKFLAAAQRFSFENKDTELHFQTGGVKSESHNDRIKDESSPVSYIPEFSNTTVVDVHTSRIEESDFVPNADYSKTSTSENVFVESTALTARNMNASASVPKYQPENVSQGSQVRKTASSQPLSQNVVINYTSSPVVKTSSSLTSALTRMNTDTRPNAYLSSNHLLNNVSVKPSENSIPFGQPQNIAVVNQNSVNQFSNMGNQVQTTDCQSISNSVGSVNTNKIKSLIYNFEVQEANTSVQSARVDTVSMEDSITLNANVESEVLVEAPAHLPNHAVASLNNVGIEQFAEREESHTNLTKTYDVATKSAVKGTEKIVNQGALSSKMSLENVSQNVTNQSRVEVVDSTFGDVKRSLSEESSISANNCFLNDSKHNDVPSSREDDSQVFKQNRSSSSNSELPNALVNRILPTSKSDSVTLARNKTNRENNPPSDLISANRNTSLVKMQVSRETKDNTVSEKDNKPTQPALINKISMGCLKNLEASIVSFVLNTTGTTITSTTMSTTTTAPTTTSGNRTYGSTYVVSNKKTLNAVPGVARSLTNGSQSSTTQGVANASINSNQPSISDNRDVVPSKNHSLPGKNILAAVKRNSGVTKSTNSQYLMPNNRTSIEVCKPNEGTQNIMISQNSNSSTIHYTVVSASNATAVQQQLQQESLNSVSGGSEEKVIKQNNLEPSNPFAVPLLNSSVNSVFGNELTSANPKTAENKIVEERKVEAESKKYEKCNSSPPAVQNEGSFIKKQVLNNQKITILVQNDEGDRDRAESQQKNKANELSPREEQRSCITFRAIKRTQPEGSQSEFPAKRKGSSESSDCLKKDNMEKLVNVSGDKDSVVKVESNSSSESRCQYLVLEAVADPSGALPKFNQAFGKSYQVKMPQTLKPAEPNDAGGTEGIFGAKPEIKLSNEPRAISAAASNQVPVTEMSRDVNAFEIVQKPVKSVYIDKEVKLNVQHCAKPGEEAMEPANISTIQMTEVQQPSVQIQQNVSKLARSSVVQQLLRKVPTAGPPTLQVAPVIYTQNPGEPTTQTQTLLLAAVPTGSRGVTTGTQLLRIPSSSGVWKMTSSVNPPRIVQLRPQNLVLQSGHDQGLLMQNGQPVLLHHLTSLPIRPLGVVTKSDQNLKMNVKNDYSKLGISVNDAKIGSASLETDQASIKSGTSNTAPVVSEHETVSLMKDIKEFENVFEETKLKFEMEEQQAICLSEVESVPQIKNPLTTVNLQSGAHPIHQTVLVQPQLMLHKSQMIITSTVQNQQTIFTQKIDKQITLENEQEKRLILTTNPTKPGSEEASKSHVAVAYVSHSAPTAVTVQKPLVVVTNYAQAPTSPAPSITSQNSSSPNSVVSSVSFSGSSPCKTTTKSKSRSIKPVLNPSKATPVTKPQQKPQEDASTAQKIYAILEEYAVQLRNSPDMNNRPAPRRRSNPPTSTNTKRKKIVCKSKESFSDGDDTSFAEEGTEALASGDNSSGVTVLQVCVSSSH